MAPVSPQPAESAHPRLRSDLEVAVQHEAGRKWVVVRNPSTDRYHRMSPAAIAVLRRLDGRTTVAELVDEGGPGTRADAIQKVVDRARRAGLFEGVEAARADVGLLARALLFKVWTFDPTRLLAVVEPWLRPLFSRWGVAVLTAGVVLCTGLILHRHAQFAASLRTFDRLDGWLAGYACLFLATLVHEAGHAVACRRYRGAVREAGVMVYLFMPMAYTDISASWLFDKRNHRFVAALGGVYCEAFLLCATVVAWATTAPYGNANQLAFVVMLLIGVRLVANLLPVLRLDGYWVLADWVGIPNLRPKAFFRLLTMLGPRWSWSTRPSRTESRVLLAYGLLSTASVAAAFAGIAVGLWHLLAGLRFGTEIFWISIAAASFAVVVSLLRNATALQASYGAAEYGVCR